MPVTEEHDGPIAQFPEMYGLLRLIRSMLDIGTVAEVVSLLQQSSQFITIENTLLLSRLCRAFGLEGGTGYFFLNSIFAMFQYGLIVSKETGGDVAGTVKSLSSTAFHPTERRRQITFQESARYIADKAPSLRTQVFFEARVWGFFRAWAVQGPPIPTNAGELFAMMTRVDDKGIAALYSEPNVSTRDALKVHAKATEKYFGQPISKMARAMAVRSLTAILLVAALLGVLLVMLRTAFSHQTPTWLRVAAAGGIVFLLVIGAAVFIGRLVVARMQSARPGRVMGVTVGSGEEARIHLNPNLADDEFRKAVDHELGHLMKELGHFKRDLATLTEAALEWETNRLSSTEADLVRQGYERPGEQQELLRTVDSYLSDVDKRRENPSDYKIGFYILGVVKRICRDDIEHVHAFISELLHGEDAGAALEEVACIRHLEAEASALQGPSPSGRSAALVALLYSFLALNDEGRLPKRLAAAFLDGKNAHDSGKVSELLNSTRNGLAKNKDRPSLYWCAVLSGLVLNHCAGDVRRALADCERLLKTDAPLDDVLALAVDQQTGGL